MVAIQRWGPELLRSLTTWASGEVQQVREGGKELQKEAKQTGKQE